MRYVDFILPIHYNFDGSFLTVKEPERMRKPICPKLLVWIIAIGLIFPVSTLNATTISPASPSTDDERKIEEDREKAILEALMAVEPSLPLRQPDQGKTVKGTSEVIQDVENIRQARKEKFKYLSEGYIKQAVTPEAVGEKELFLEKREKNLQDVLARSVDVSVQAEVAKERVTLAKFRIAKAIRDFFPEAAFEADVKKGSLS